MSAMPTASLSRRALALGVVLTTFGATGVASATEPQRIDGNPRCADGLRELKLDPVPQGTTTLTDGTLSVTVTVSGRRFSWTASQGVDVVLAKGGPMANRYAYSPEGTSGSDLTPPMNKTQPYGISHITFCYDTSGDVPPPPPGPCEDGGPTTRPNGEPCDPPGPCEEGGPTTKPNGEPCVPPPPGPCEEGGPTTMPNGEPCNPPGPCEEGGPTTMPNGQPCVPVGDPPRNDPPRNDPPRTNPPVSMTIPSTGGVLGATSRVGRRVAARAGLVGPSRCVRRAFTARINGRGIRRVTIYVNGRRTRVLRGNRLSIRVTPKGRVTRVRARVEFVAASRRRPQTLSLTALRCAQQAVSPSFTG